MKLSFYFCRVLILVCTLFFVIPVYAVTFPTKPIDTNFYVDDAKIISALAANQINEICKNLWRDKQVAMLVVTIPSLASRDAGSLTIDQYATSLFNYWGIGSKQNNNGILFLVSKEDRRARIEFGASWGNAYDSQAKVIMDSAIIPSFKQGDYSTGIVNGVSDLDKLARGTQSFKKAQPWWAIPAMILGFCTLIAMIISLFRSGRNGWAWIMIIALIMMIWYVISNIRIGGGRFGGGSSGRGGSSGSW